MRMLLTATMLVGVLACEPAEQCPAACDPGSICRGSVCRSLCNEDSDCVAVSEACTDGLCVGTTRECSPGLRSYWPLAGPPQGRAFSNAVSAAVAACQDACPTYVGESQSVRFDGTDELNVKSFNAAPFRWRSGDSFSVELWVRPAGCSESRSQVFVGRDGTNEQNVSGTSMHWQLGHSCPEGELTWVARGAGESGTLLRGPVVTDGRWHHVVAIRQAEAQRTTLYVDGVLRAAATHALGDMDSPQDAPLNVGWLDDREGHHYEGSLKHLALYGRALSTSEVRSHFTNGPGGGPCAGPAERCGNGVADAGEVCDGGNDCRIICTAPLNCAANIENYFPFDGTFRDTQGTLAGSCSATPLSSTPFPPCPQPTSGRRGEAFRFDGVSTGLEIRDAAGISPLSWGRNESFTIQFWYQAIQGVSCPADGGTNDNEVVLGRSNEEGAVMWWVGCQAGSGEARFYLADTENTGFSLAGGTINDGQWHHVAAIRDGFAGRNLLFVDGVEVARLATTYLGDFVATTPVHVGRLGAAFHLQGKLDEFAIHNVALSAAEVRASFSAGVCGD